MSKHIATVHIPSCEIDRINHLLGIDYLEDMSDEELIMHGANTHQNEGIYSVTFDDGSSLNYDLCSDIHNYWDDVVWTNADGSSDLTLDCEYEIDDIEIDIEGETYVVEIIKD